MLENVILGAGPYGLSVAAHFHYRGIPFRAFGRPMDSWLNHMPQGMMLKSDGFASNLSDPSGAFTLKHFCTENGIEYADRHIPVKLDTFSAYGLAFRNRLVSELEELMVVSVRRSLSGFLLQLENGESVHARRVVVAAGISHFQYIPPALASLSSEFVSHSFDHHNPESLRGRSVVIVGSGASAFDLAGLLHRAGVDVRLVARTKSLVFHNKGSASERRSWWQRLRHPDSGLGPGLRSWFFAQWPMIFHYLPQSFRLEAVRTHLGQSGGWFTKPMVLGKVPLLIGQSIERASIQGHKVHLHLRGVDRVTQKVSADHVIAATGYRVNMEKLTFLDPEIRAHLTVVEGSPVLSSSFESSVSGLYFVGLMAANSFGPVMRFACGAPFAARRITRRFEKLAALKQNSHSVAQVDRVGNRTAHPA
jgi:thioredoxin reductase